MGSMSPLERKEAGNQLFKEGKWNEAVEQYTHGLESENIPPDQKGLLLSNRSQCFLKLSDWHRSLEDANACLVLLPEHAKSLVRRATALEQLGRREEALNDYARVARAEPTNALAVNAARRLREELAMQKSQRDTDSLPSRLLQKISSADQAEACSACEQLRKNVVLERNQVASVVKLGAVATLLTLATTSSTQKELRQAALHCVCTLVSDRDLMEDGEHRSLSASATEARRQVREHLSGSLQDLGCRCKEHGGSMVQLAHLLGYCGDLEDETTLELLQLALDSIEESVHRAGLVGLNAICAERRRLGSKGASVMASRALLKCLEAALHSQSQELLQGLLAEVFALLADDEDRPQHLQVDLASVGLQVLEPFLQAEEPLLRSNGLAGLTCLLAAKSKAAKVLQHSSAPLAAMLRALQPGSDGGGGEAIAARSHAAECLLLAASDVSTRQRWIEGGGIDVIMNALGTVEGQDRGFVDAKLVAVLAIMAAHNKDVRDEVFDRVDFMMELRFALEVAQSRAAAASSKEEKRQARRLCSALYESFACLSIHGEFKEMLISSKKTLAALTALAKEEDLGEDGTLSFFFAMLIYNLCRSREDKTRKKTGNPMIDELGSDDLKALEEFYERMPAEARPQRNGEVDAGDKNLALKMQAWCLQREGSAAAPVVLKLCRCIRGSSVHCQVLIAEALRLLCQDQNHRKFVAASHGIRSLLDLEKEPKASEAARQALAQILISTNPASLQYQEQLDSVRPLLEMFSCSNELYQFEGAMALTNLLTSSEELRGRALQGGAWNLSKDLLFSDNEQVQCAGLEVMCNLTMSPEVVERFAEGHASVELQLLGAFCQSEELRTSTAASGALAMMAEYPEVAEKIANCEHCVNGLLKLLESQEDGLQHRAMVLACALAEAKDVGKMVVKKVKARYAEGFSSAAARGLAQDLLKDFQG